MIRGSYRGLNYTIQMTHHPIIGNYYDIIMTTGLKLSYERESSLSRGIQLICEQMDNFPLEAEIVMFHSHNSDTLISRWNQSNKLIKHQAAITAPKVPALIAEMILIAMELKKAGYGLGEDGYWYHLSKVN